VAKSEFEWAPVLLSSHVEGCRVFESRYALVHALLPRGSEGMELGVQAGYFSRFLIETIDPSVLHLVDIDLGQIRYDESPALRERAHAGFVRLHQGDSRRVLETFADASLDWIYVDAAHDYDAVREDLAQAARIVRPGGLIVCNDYTQWSPIENKAYGVAKAVNELCLAGGWRLVALGLHGAGYHDVALGKVRA
jgi:predicted O-methyltransferase YrrM